MKKLFMGSVALLMFSIAMMIFQISCKKEVIAVPTVTADPATVFQEGKLILQNTDGSPAIINYDGTNKKNITVTLPAGWYPFWTHGITLTPDHKTIFFTVMNNADQFKATQLATYSCGLDGSNTKKVSDLIGGAGSRIAF